MTSLSKEVENEIEQFYLNIKDHEKWILSTNTKKIKELKKIKSSKKGKNI